MKNGRARQVPRASFRKGTGLTLIDAPWRHTYFDAPPDPDCFICRAFVANPRDDAKNLLLVRGTHAGIVLNRYPYTMGALMVAPVAHVDDLRRIDDAVLDEMNRLVKRGMDILDAALQPKGFNIGLNQGVDAGAGLKDHIHLHIVPRWRGDTNYMTTIGETRVLAEDVDSMYRRLRRAMKKGGG